MAEDCICLVRRRPHDFFVLLGRFSVDVCSAQRHFCRATRLDPQCAEAWIAFGTSFAACDESDQALASFRAAQRLAPGNHVSLLYIGMEYLRTNHLVLAQHFLSAANDSCNGTDPLAKSELGVLNLYQKNYGPAISWFLQALGASVDELREAGRHNSTCLLDVDALSALVEGVQDDYWVSGICANTRHCGFNISKYRWICHRVFVSPAAARFLALCDFAGTGIVQLVPCLPKEILL